MNELGSNSTKASVLGLPHPVRIGAAAPEYATMLEELLPPKAWQKLKAEFANNSRRTSDIVAEVVDRPGFEKLNFIARESTQVEGGTGVGNFYATMLAMRHSAAPQPFFRVDSPLCQLLLNTDLDDDLPVDVLQVPYPRFYVEFGTARDVPLTVRNAVSGDHILEGAYIEYETRADQDPGLYVMLTGSPIGKLDALDDATLAVFLPLRKDLTLRQALRWSFEEGVKSSNMNGFIADTEQLFGGAQESVNFLAKVLLYIGLQEARKSVHPERSEWQRSVAGLKSTAKREKAERRGRLLTDYILVTAPPPPTAEAGQTATGHAVKTHWRRGHYRMQAHGPQSQLRKLVFIRPLLVNAEAGSALVPQYRVA